MMKLFIKSLFIVFYILFIGATIVYASKEGFLTFAGDILVYILFGCSIQIMIDWVAKEVQ